VAKSCAFFMRKRRLDPAGKQEIIEIQAMGMPECKRLGEAVEAAFLAKATMLGFPVLKPWGDSRPYDFAVGGAMRGRRAVGRSIRWTISIFWRRT
jgi:hypothetical protein